MRDVNNLIQEVNNHNRIFDEVHLNINDFKPKELLDLFIKSQQLLGEIKVAKQEPDSALLSDPAIEYFIQNAIFFCESLAKILAEGLQSQMIFIDKSESGYDELFVD